MSQTINSNQYTYETRSYKIKARDPLAPDKWITEYMPVILIYPTVPITDDTLYFKHDTEITMRSCVTTYFRVTIERISDVLYQRNYSFNILLPGLNDIQKSGLTLFLNNELSTYRDSGSETGSTFSLEIKKIEDLPQYIKKGLSVNSIKTTYGTTQTAQAVVQNSYTLTSVNRPQSEPISQQASFLGGLIVVIQNEKVLCSFPINDTHWTSTDLYTTINPISTISTYNDLIVYSDGFSESSIAAATALLDLDYDNPYGIESSGTGGGDGDGTPTDDDTQTDDGVPSLSITSTGLISLYTPSLSQLQAFGNYLWSDLFSLDTFKKLFNDPMDAILGMSIVPLNLSGTSGNLIIGNIDTGLTAPRLSQQYYTIDCGSFTVQPDINSYLDYSPYTRFQLFLPYIGFKTLDADDIMGQTISIKYKIDVLTTALICEVRCNDHLRYSFSGTCGTSVPITAQSWTGMIQSVISSVTAVAALGVGAAAAPVSGGTSLAASAVGAAGSVAGNSLSMKPDIQKSGNMSGSSGFMGWQTPFLIRYTPRRVNSASQQTYTGYPSLITSKLSDVHGYTEIQSINLSVAGATEQELGEIDRQLKEGVILP